MEINILTFGPITDITGKTSWKQSGLRNTEELRLKLNHDFPGLNLIKYSIAVNQKLMHKDTLFNEGDTIALLPPFSGG